MKHAPLLKSVMTPFPYAVDVNASIEEAHRLMEEHGFHHLPVTEDGRIVGILTGRHVADLGARREAATNGIKVRDRCVTRAYTVDLNTRLDEVLLGMTERRVGSAIVTRKGRLAGVFTWADACRAFGEHLREHYPANGGDDAA